MTAAKKTTPGSFDLERAVARWKKTLRGKAALQDGDFAELEGYLRDKVDELVGRGLSEEEAFRTAEREFARGDALDGEYARARRARGPGSRPSWPLPRLVPSLLRNYFKTAVRKAWRGKAYSFISLAGLTAGMAAFLLIVVYCRFERGYDSFHHQGDRIVRVQNDRIYTGRHDRSVGCPPGLGPALKEEYPEIADYARLLNLAGDPNTVGRTAGSAEGQGAEGPPPIFYERRIFFADPSVLRIFSFLLTQGDASTALEDPESIVLTESMARKYFGGEDPVGKVLTVTMRFGRQDYRVTGVCRDVPAASHLQFDFLLSFRRLATLWPSTQEEPWSSNAFLTYLLLSSPADRTSLEAKFPRFVEKQSLETSGLRREFHLQPLRSIHLTSRLRYEAEVNGDLKTVRFLEIIGVFIILIAWMNFVNLATARSLERGKEVGVRKTLGAGRRQLIGQFLFETGFLNALAFFIAVAAAAAALPEFGRLVGKPLAFAHLDGAWIWLGAMMAAGALLAGSYPALVLSSFRPVSALHGPAQRGAGGAGLRKGLVLAQFTAAVLLIASTLTVARQLAFMRDRDLGVDIEQTLILNLPQGRDLNRMASVARDEMAGLPSVLDAAVSSSVPGRVYSNSISGVRRQAAAEETGQQAFIIDIDDHYFRFFSIPLASGRSFSRGYSGDGTAVILNEEMAAVLGFESPEKALGQNIVLGGFGGDVVQVVGVVKNHHHLSLREKIVPTLYMPLAMAYYMKGNLLALKLDGGSVKAGVASIAAKWKTLFPGQPMEYYFLAEDFNTQYDADERFGRIFGLASLLAIAISCLGLFGLVSYAAERRTREIGIRKVFGASAGGIVGLLSREFLLWVLLANLVAWPLTWTIMNRWLGRFAYRTSVGLGTLVLAGVLALIIALATVSVKAWSAAAADPVESIRRE